METQSPISVSLNRLDKKHSFTSDDCVPMTYMT